MPRLLGNRYRLERRIGQGGMGAVYKAHDLTMDRVVAVKLLKRDVTEDDPAHSERFLREARHTARLVHEHIVEVYDLGRTDEGELYFVMELLVGEPLSRILKRDKRVEPKRAIRIGMQICRALTEAHGLGIVHRDLKPGNIMMVTRGEAPDFVKVLDFGVAKSILPSGETQLTQTGMLVGTLEYMAPEQIYGRVIDTRIDIYAFGALMYRIISGTPLFIDAEGPTILQHQLHSIPQSLLLRVPDAKVPQMLDRLVQKCLMKEPADRYQTMRELEAALNDVLVSDLSHLPSLEYMDRDSGQMAWDDPSVPMMTRIPQAASSDTRVDRMPDKSFVACEQCGAKMPPYVARCPDCASPRKSRKMQTPASLAATPSETAGLDPSSSAPIPVSAGAFQVPQAAQSDPSNARSFDDAVGLNVRRVPTAPTRPVGMWQRFKHWLRPSR